MTFKPIRIAIASDLHIGDAAKGADLRLNNPHDAVVSNYLEPFRDFVQEKGIVADYLLIPGDITNKADPLEFQRASEVIVDIASFLNVDKRKIVFVPGNHDKNWGLISSCQGLSSEAVQQISYSPLMQESLLFKEQMDIGNGCFIQDPYCLVWSFEELIVFALNSSLHDAPETGIDPHHGKLTREMLAHLDEVAGSFKTDQRMKVCLVHHHPYLYTEPTDESKDFSAMHNSQELLEIVARNRIDAVVHGHKHVPSFLPMSNGFHPLLLLSSGSFSAELYEKWHGSTRNQFHLLELDQRCPTDLVVKGCLKSWSYFHPHGWRESRELMEGINHHLGFGCHLNTVQLKARIKPIIEGLLSAEGYFNLEQVAQSFENLKFAYMPTVMDALEELKEELGFVIRAEPKLLDVLILKRR